jgi:hypothetical protein
MGTKTTMAITLGAAMLFCVLAMGQAADTANSPDNDFLADFLKKDAETKPHTPVAREHLAADERPTTQAVPGNEGPASHRALWLLTIAVMMLVSVASGVTWMVLRRPRHPSPPVILGIPSGQSGRLPARAASPKQLPLRRAA